MEKNARPPLLIERLFERCLPADTAYEKLGDFEEAYREMRLTRGRRAAELFYVSQIVRAAPALASESFRGSIIMLKNYLTAAFRNLTRNRVYSFLNILGLSVGIAAFLLIGLYVRREWSYDRYHENADRIFKVIAADQAVTPYPLAPALEAEFPEIEAATRIVGNRRYLIRCRDREFFDDHWVWADERFLSIFSYPLLAGDPETALRDPDSMVISRETADKYFGGEDPLGRVLHWTGQGMERDFKVTGVMRDIPPQSHVQADILGSFKTCEDFPSFDPDPRRGQYGWGNYWAHTFFRLRDGHDPADLAAKYGAFLTEQTGNERQWDFRNRPLVDLHLKSSDLVFHFGPVNDIHHIRIFAVVGLIILLIAGFNYINLTTALSGRRMREVGIRKVVGAQRRQMVRQFLGESLLITLLTLPVAAALAWLAQPVFNRMIQSETPVRLFADAGTMAGLLGIGLAVGLLSGVYPAFVMATFTPRRGLGGGSPGRNRRGLRGVLVVAQFAISIFLIAGTLITARQLDYIRNKNLGFSKKHILIAPLRGIRGEGQRAALQQELLRLPGVGRVSESTTIPMKLDWHTGFYFQNEADPGDNHLMSHYARVDYDYVDVFDLKMVRGRNFRREIDEGRNAYIINETIARRRGWENPVGRTYGQHGRMGTIVGVVGDFHNENMHIPIGEVTLVLAPGRGGTMSIKLNTGDMPGTLAAIEQVYTRFSGDYPFEYEFMDDRYDNMYKNEIRLGRAFNHFAALAVLLCCLGLLGLVSFTIDQSAREIAVRKVLGASVSSLVQRLSWKFIRGVVLANLIAWPLAYFGMNSWLRGFVYRIDIGLSSFVIAGSAAAVIAFLTVLARTSRAALSNPVDSLRHE